MQYLQKDPVDTWNLIFPRVLGPRILYPFTSATLRSEIDLVLDAEAEINISSGFHLAIDDGLAIKIELFNQEVSNITFPGGRFEFLPVTIASGTGAVLTAVLQVAIYAGFAIVGGSIDILGDEFAQGCDPQIEEYYKFALGAAAGATAHFDSHTWGPSPNTTRTTAIYATTLASACAIQSTSVSSAVLTSATGSGSHKERDDSDWSTT
ncbi:hypothetical protein F5Y16DRAFT_397527 [Xylariaceae sp. FL0255]|nr:hypothetical protein F5Y16DRAFT_397527 [Xylariaceae sp. FL0255]